MAGCPRTKRCSALAVLAVAASLLAVLTAGSRRSAVAQPYPGYEVVATYPHKSNAFTEGLAFRQGRLFEGTGNQGHSFLRRVVLTTGEVKREHELAEKYFGEGITTIGDKVFQLTWQNGRGWVYGAKTFHKLGTFTYEGEGWGLTDDGHELVMSNGTDVVRFRDPGTFEVIREIHVTDGGNAVSGLNELEWVEGEIYANVFPGDDVVRINPESGEVTGRFNLTPLHEQETAQCHHQLDVTNGIAYMQSQQRLFVTGKYWCHLYEIELTPAPTPSPG
jgi:glutamine cyclotransferase